MKTDTAKKIWDLINASRNLVGADAIDDSLHLSKVGAFVKNRQPVQLVLPGFPAKSANPRKTLGYLPDYGEVLALVGLDGLCRRIEEVYAPGARLVICSDGRVFNDLVLVSDSAVDRYKHGIAQIMQRYALANLSTFDLDDIMPRQACFDQARSDLVEKYGESIEAVRARAAADRSQGALFNGIHRFLFEDQVVLKPLLSRTRVRALTKELAYAVIQRSNAWSRLVEEQFPDAVRLSIHPQAAGSSKVGIRLLPSNDAWRTPWHSAALYDGRGYVLVKREEAEAMRAELIMADGQYPYYSMVGSLPQAGLV